MFLLAQAGPQDARLAMMRLYAGLKGSEDEENPVSRARAAGPRQDIDGCLEIPAVPFTMGVKKM
jgi:hypothetical protein